MPLGSRLNIESNGMFAAIVFYLAAGIAFLALLPWAEFLPSIGFIGIFSVIAAYGVFKKRNWTIYFVVILFLTGTTFSGLTLYYYFLTNYALTIGMIAYLVLIWIFTGYIFSKRRTLET